MNILNKWLLMCSCFHTTRLMCKQSSPSHKRGGGQMVSRSPVSISSTLISAPGTRSAQTLIRIFTNVTTLAFIITAMWVDQSSGGGRLSERWSQTGAGQLGGGTASVIVKYLYLNQSPWTWAPARHYLGLLLVFYILNIYTCNKVSPACRKKLIFLV